MRYLIVAVLININSVDQLTRMFAGRGAACWTHGFFGRLMTAAFS